MTSLLRWFWRRAPSAAPEDDNGEWDFTLVLTLKRADAKHQKIPSSFGPPFAAAPGESSCLLCRAAVALW